MAKNIANVKVKEHVGGTWGNAALDQLFSTHLEWVVQHGHNILPTFQPWFRHTAILSIDIRYGSCRRHYRQQYDGLVCWMFTLSVWARLLLPITDGRTHGRLSWVLFFLSTFLVCNGDKISGLIYWSINPQIYTVTKLRCRSGGTVVRRQKVTGLRKMEYNNCHGITYLRTTKAIRGKLKPHTAKDEEWSYRICAIGRTLNIVDADGESVSIQ